MNSFLEQLRAFGVVRFAAVAGLAAGLAIALVLFATNIAGGGQSLLYAGLAPADAAAAGERLDQAGIPYELRAGGAAIYVPRDRVDEARVRVASQGALGFGSVGYEIFDRSDALGSTSFVQNMNAKRALEGELARTIQSLDSVQSARVHLVLPERRPFERDRARPSASVVIGARGALASEQAFVIRNLIATAVPDLAAERITIADERGRLLVGAATTEGAGASMLEDRRQALEDRLARRILDLVEGVVGPGAARVQVTAELNRDSVTESSEVYDPDGQVVRSRQRDEQTGQDTNRNGANRVSASENLPGADEGAEQAGSTSITSRSGETTNFDISRTTRTQVREAGGVDRLSVAVAVDGVLQTAEDGSVQYRPRPAEEMASIEALVRSAMGYTAERGDSLEVTNVQFARADVALGSPARSSFSFGRDEIMRAAEIAVMFVTALLVIFLVARPLAKSAGSGGGGARPLLATAGSAPGGEGGAEALNAPAAHEAVAAPASVGALPSPQARDLGIDIAKIDGQVRASSVKKVAGLVEHHPEESISILRTWMHE